MVQQVNVKCTIMLFFTDITCFPPDLTEVAPLNISGKFKFHNFFCFFGYANFLKKLENRTLGGRSARGSFNNYMDRKRQVGGQCSRKCKGSNLVKFGPRRRSRILDAFQNFFGLIVYNLLAAFIGNFRATELTLISPMA